MFKELRKKLIQESGPVLARWHAVYDQWLADGRHHYITGEAWDKTSERIGIPFSKPLPEWEEERIGNTSWDSFLLDYSDNWQATYISGAGKHWLTYGELLRKDLGLEAAVETCVCEQYGVDWVDDLGVWEEAEIFEEVCKWSVVPQPDGLGGYRLVLKHEENEA